MLNSTHVCRFLECKNTKNISKKQLFNYFFFQIDLYFNFILIFAVLLAHC